MDFSRNTPDLELVSNASLILQLESNAMRLPLTHAWQSALLLEAARRIQCMHADYIANGPMADDERRLT